MGVQRVFPISVHNEILRQNKIPKKTETTSASTVEDILRLGKEGWIEYSVVKVSNVEYHCFKKPKRFSSYV